MPDKQRSQEAGQPLGSRVMAATRLTGFEQVLIGLIFARPASGYDLKRHFATTPASVYQPSSGALYPALRRLERAGLMRTAEQPARKTGDLRGGHQGPGAGQRSADAARRQRYVYHVTEQGAAVHAAWIREPVNPATVSQDLGLHLMRFVMMERQLPRAEVLAFLASLRAALADFLTGIERYLTSLDPAQATDMHGHLALEHGIALHRASLDWTGRAIAALTQPPAG
jgi:DNA-binding PadR family transcriptional regulator